MQTAEIASSPSHVDTDVDGETDAVITSSEKVTSASPFVRLLGGLRKNYSSDFHRIQRKAFKLFKRGNTHCVRANLFSEHVINCWNSLPDSVDFSSFTTFSRTVKQVDFFHDFSDINNLLVLCSML